MAAPPDVNLRDMSGRWEWNAGLSSDPKLAMKLQGISWLIQVAISKAPITLEITQDKDEATGKPRIVAVQRTLAHVVENHRVLDWVEIEQSHLLFGELKTRARMTALADLEDAYLAEGWEPELEEVIEA